MGLLIDAPDRGGAGPGSCVTSMSDIRGKVFDVDPHQITFTLHQSSLTSMPTICSISSASNAALSEQYKRGFNQSRVCYNTNGYQYACGMGFTLYPELEDVYVCSNGVGVDDKSFKELGLSNFIIVRQYIAHHQFDRWHNIMNAHQRDILFRGLEPWDRMKSTTKFWKPLWCIHWPLGLCYLNNKR